MSRKCPVCGTLGKLWNKNPEAFICPKCFTFFSKFGFILESEIEPMEVWA
jgi:rubredoxin